MIGPKHMVLEQEFAQMEESHPFIWYTLDPLTQEFLSLCSPQAKAIDCKRSIWSYFEEISQGQTEDSNLDRPWLVLLFLSHEVDHSL